LNQLGVQITGSMGFPPSRSRALKGLSRHQTNMDPRLEVISGPLKGEIFPLLVESISLGGALSNDICINDKLVSQQHCLIQKESGQYHLVDLASRNGTYLNELPVKHKLLEHGDRIFIGDSLLIFLSDEMDYALLASFYERVANGLIGESQRMHEVHEFISKVAPTTSTVLIRGESGTGKELAAHAIHLNSSRKNTPFVAINCAALSEPLLESELFGHEKGSFTGAIGQKKGRLEFADGGIVFLDEVGELAPSLQAKLLRMLETHEFERVGGTHPVSVNIRLLSATNRNLEEAIKAGTFRADLYYRLAVVTLTMPPLRECREDIPLLASYFAARCCQRSKRRVMGISRRARAYLMQYEWPGNVRELQNAVERAVVLGSENCIQPEDLPESVLERDLSAETSLSHYHDAIKHLKKQLILKAIKQANGSCTRAAKVLGLHPNHLHRLIRNLNLKPELKK
jgi:transcriptional regulator with GAF, ATPase, and Fis domain